MPRQPLTFSLGLEDRGENPLFSTQREGRGSRPSSRTPGPGPAAEGGARIPERGRARGCGGRDGREGRKEERREGGQEQALCCLETANTARSRCPAGRGPCLRFSLLIPRDRAGRAGHGQGKDPPHLGEMMPLI